MVCLHCVIIHELLSPAIGIQSSSLVPCLKASLIESTIDKDLSVLETGDNQLDKPIEQLRLWQGGLRVEAVHFKGWWDNHCQPVFCPMTSPAKKPESN